jgi:hypothetical protein
MCEYPYNTILTELNPSGNQNLYEKTKPFIRDLRKSFREKQTVDYKNPYYRAAYMIAYYPFYIKPINYVLSKNLNAINLQEYLSIAFVGCGAAPELVGLGYFFKENKIESVRKIRAFLYDRNDEYWREARIISEKLFRKSVPIDLETNHIFCNFFQTHTECIHQNLCCDIFPETEIVVLQNFIGDMPNQNANIKEELLWIFNIVKKGCLIVIIDFSYQRTRDILDSIENEIQRNFGNCEILNSQKDSYTEIPGFTLPAVLRSTIFTGEEDLIPRTVTKFVYTVIRKG